LDLPYTILTPNFDYVISYNLWSNEPQYKRDVDIDFYITNLHTGKTKLMVDKLPKQVNYLTISDDGNFIKYFKKDDWWIYDINKEQHINLTKNLSSELSYSDFDQEFVKVAYGSPGWSMDNKSILIYDKYDIWEISLDG